MERCDPLVLDLFEPKVARSRGSGRMMAVVWVAMVGSVVGSVVGSSVTTSIMVTSTRVCRLDHSEED